MAGKIVSIEIGALVTYVAELDYKAGTPKIYHAFSIPTPDEVIADGSITPVPEFLKSLKAELAKRNIKTKKVIFVMNSARIASREVTIPAVKESRIHDLLVTNSAEFFPVDLQQYQLVHKIIRREKDEKNKKKDKTFILSVLAVPNEIITSYCNFAAKIGLQVEALDYLGNSIAQGMLKMTHERIKVAIKVDELSSFLTVIEGENIEMQRNISYGIKDAVDAVVESRLFGENLSFHEGMDVMRRKTCMFRRLNDSLVLDSDNIPEVDAEKLRILREDVTENVRALVGNIIRVLDYYTARNPETVIPEIWLLGPGADCSGLSRLLTNELNIKVKPLQSLDSINFGKTADEDVFRVAEFIAPIAAALHPLELSLNTAVKGKNSLPGREFLVPGIVCAVCILISCGLTGFTFFTTWQLEQRQLSLERRVRELEPVEQIQKTYNTVLAKYTGIQELNGLTKTPGDALLAFYGEMEEKMPSDILVSGMNAGPEGISMNITVANKLEAAEVLIQLRTFSTVDMVSTAGIEAEDHESGASGIRFTVECRYAVPAEKEDGNEQ